MHWILILSCTDYSTIGNQGFTTTGVRDGSQLLRNIKKLLRYVCRYCYHYFNIYILIFNRLISFIQTDFGDYNHWMERRVAIGIRINTC